MVPGFASKPVCSSAVFALLVPAPTSGPASRSVTCRSNALSSRAIAQPTTPAPTIATSVSNGSCTAAVSPHAEPSAVEVPGERLDLGADRAPPGQQHLARGDAVDAVAIGLRRA